MWHRLALAFGCRVPELQARMRSSEFTEWVAYDAIEPIGPERLELLLCGLASTLMSCWVGDKSPTAEELLPHWLRDRHQVSAIELMSGLTAAVHGLAEQSAQARLREAQEGT